MAALRPSQQRTEPGGLVSEALFRDLLATTFSRRADSGLLAVLRVLLDGVPVDDTVSGDTSGARFAKECAALCRAAGEDGVAAPYGPTGFALLLDALPAPHHATHLAERIGASFRGRPEPGPDGAAQTISVGIAFNDDDGVHQALDVLDHAETAVRDAQAQGGDRCVVYDAAKQRDLAARLQVRTELYDSIDAGRFEVHYQPAVTLSSGQVTMVEALVRWDHPTSGLVAAAEFIELVAEHDLILPLGAWVLNEACAQLARWTEAFGDQTPALAVNFSEHQLRHPAAVSQVRGVIEANGIALRQLFIEIAATTLLSDDEAPRARLRELAALGVRLSIDHFATSASALADVQDLPIDLVKIDRSIIEAADGDGDRSVIEAVVAAGRSRGMTVAAEGIERAAQLTAVRALGVEQAQGYLFGRPQPADEIAVLIAASLAAGGE